MSLKSAPGTNRMKRRTSDAVAELKGENVDEALKRVNNDSQLRGYALRWGQKGRGGFRCPPQTLLDLPFPSPDDQGCDPGPIGICEADHTAPGPGPQSWSFQGGMGVQRDVGGKSKSPLIPLGPAQRASPEDGNLQYLLVNICSLMLPTHPKQEKSSILRWSDFVNQYLRLRAASAFFLRRTDGFS